MDEQEIIRRAQAEIAARRTQQAPAGTPGPVRQLLVALVLAIPVIFLVLPGWLPRKLLLSMGGLCGLRPSHSYYAGELQLPLESRMIGIYGGFLLTLVVLLMAGRLGARRLGGSLILRMMLLFITSMIADGFNSLFIELGWPHPYETTNLIRLITGLLSGIGLATIIVWLLGSIGMPPAERERLVLQSPWEVLVPLLVNGLFAAIVVQEQAIFYYPIALIGVLGGVLLVAVTVLLVILSRRRYEHRITRARQLFVPGSVALLIAFAVVAGMAVARWSVTMSPI